MKFIIKIAAFSFIIAFLICFQPSLAQETQDHWLIGRWEGNISGYIGRSSPRRTLRVIEVAPDGAAKGMWYVTGQQALPAFIRVEELQVKILTAGSSVVELTREGNDLLVGNYISENGQPLPVRLTRTETPSEAGEK